MTTAPPVEQKRTRFTTWHGRLLGFLLVIFALELGLFLVVFPWLKSWDLNSMRFRSPALAKLWMTGYFRGAISGLGALNLYVALAELIRQLKAVFARE